MSLQVSPEVPADSSPTPFLTRSDVPWLAVSVLAAVCLRAVWVMYVNVDPNEGRFDDSVFYHNVAHVLAEGLGYSDPWIGGPTAHWMPAYPAALAVLYKLFGWHLVLAKGLNIGLAAATVALTYLIAKRIFDRRVAYLGALVLAFFPGQIYFSTLVMAETMFAVAFLLVLLLALMWTVDRPTARWWQVLLIGVLVGASAMVRAEGVFLSFVLAVLWALTVRPWRTVARYAALLALGVVLALTPWTVRNAFEFHAFIPLRPDAGSAISASLDPQTDIIGQPPVERRAVGDSLRLYLEHPREIFSLVGTRLPDLYGTDADGVFWIQAVRRPGGVGEFHPPFTADQELRWRGLADRYYFGAGAAALVAAAICLLRRNRASLVLLVAALAWTLLFAFFSPQPRYHFPLGAAISILAGAFLTTVWDGAVIAARRRGQTKARGADTVGGLPGSGVQ